MSYLVSIFIAIIIGLILIAFESHYDKEILYLKQDIRYLKAMVKCHTVEISELIREKDND